MPARAAPRVARELVQHDDLRQRRARLCGPGCQLAAQARRRSARRSAARSARRRPRPCGTTRAASAGGAPRPGGRTRSPAPRWHAGRSRVWLIPAGPACRGGGACSCARSCTTAARASPSRAGMGQRGLHQRGGDAVAFGLRRHLGVHDVHQARRPAGRHIRPRRRRPRHRSARPRRRAGCRAVFIAPSCCHRKANSSASMSARCALSAAPPWPPSMFS